MAEALSARRLDGRRAIVTGAASGIGRASAELFALEGARVLAVDRPGTNLNFGDAAISGFEQDIAAADAPERLLAAAHERLGGLDTLFNNAGVSGNRLAAETTDEEFDRQHAVNTRAAFRITRAAIPDLMQTGRGRILCTASVMAEGTDYGLIAYCASKAAVLGLVRTWALELGRYGITANAVLPGAILTGMTQASFQRPEAAANWTRKAALKRLGQPIDIARAAAFLCSDDGGFITGQAIAVDGGLTLRV